MSDFDDTNKGVLFRKYEKESENHPDYNGQVNIEGKEYWVSGWKNTSKNGAPYVKLLVKPKEESGKNSEAWQNAREKFKKDEVVAVDQNEDVNLDNIPF